ncbi:DUF22 domain-containing protein [Geoglobus ahangari]
MRCGIAYFRDIDKKIPERGELSFKNAIFKSAGQAYWKVLIADESVEVRKNTLEIIRVRKLHLPPKSTIAPLSIMRHALGTTLDIVPSEIKKVEETREVTHVLFYSIDDGFVERGDIIGVIKVYPINVGSPDEQEFIRAPDVKPRLEDVEGNVVFREGDEIVREKVRVKETWYSRWNLGEWRMMVADEDVKLIPGDARLVKIRAIELPPNTIPVPLYGYRTPFGTVLDIYAPGRPRKIEEKKLVTHALLMPTEEGEVRKGDVIGVLNIYAVGVGEMVARLTPFLTERSRGNVVLRSGEGIRRVEFEHRPFVFRRSSVGYLKPIIAAETKRVQANKPEKIEIEKIDVPAGSIIQPMSGKGHAYGITIDVEFERQGFVEEDRVIDSAVILSPFDGEILRGDMIGVLMQYHITPLAYPEIFVRKYV